MRHGSKHNNQGHDSFNQDCYSSDAGFNAVIGDEAIGPSLHDTDTPNTGELDLDLLHQLTLQG